MTFYENWNYTCIESFSGPGGMSLGLHQAGFNVLISFDIDKMSVSTHNLNLGNRCIQADVKSLSGSDLLLKASLQKGELDLFAGGPPCQGFSKQKKGAHLGDNRNDLVFEYIRLVKEMQPKFFIFENVAIFGQLRGKKYILEMEKTLSDYILVPNSYNSKDYGLAQTRERFIIVGKRKDICTDFVIPSHSKKKNGSIPFRTPPYFVFK